MSKDQDRLRTALLTAIRKLGYLLRDYPDDKETRALIQDLHTCADGPLASQAQVAGAEEIPPIPMVLHCPECRARHIDRGDFATKPHHTHACQSCGVVWRPAVVNTVGVNFLPGFKDEEEP